MPRIRSTPGAGPSARGRGCLPGPAGIPDIFEKACAAKPLWLSEGDDEPRAVHGAAASLVRRLAQAGPAGLRLTGRDLELAKALGADGLPLCISRSDAKGRARVHLDTSRIVEVNDGL